jgi:hypothetical protein
MLLGALSGCNLVAGGVNVEPVAVASQKPGNVALYVSVSKLGNGVLGLKKDDFKVYENDFPLDNEQIKLTLLSTNPSTRASRLSLRRARISSGGGCIADGEGRMRMSIEQPRSSQMYVPTVLPSSPACPARGAVNNVTWLDGCAMRHREHIALMPCSSENSDARRMMPIGVSSRQCTR